MSSNDANSGNPKQPSPVHSAESSSLPTVIGSPSSGAAGLPVGPFSWTDSQNMGPSLSVNCPPSVREPIPTAPYSSLYLKPETPVSMGNKRDG